MREALRDLDEQLGGFGKFQKWVFFLACLPPVMTGLSVVNQVFIGLAIPYRCVVPECEDASNLSYVEDFLNFTTPQEAPDGAWSSCTTFSYNDNVTIDRSCDQNAFDSSRLEECSEWVYDTSIFESTLVSEFNLTCSHAWMQSLGGSVYMFGMPFGAVFLGDLADRIGRRKGLVVSLLVLFVGEAVGSVSVNFYMYLVMRFISGIGSIASFQNAFILAMETVSTEWRTFCGMMIKVPFALGETSVAAAAYFIRNWRWLQFSLSLPPFFLLSYWWILPESIRWSLSKGKLKEAKEVMKKAARMNNVDISQDTYDTLILKASQEEQSGGTKSNKRRSAFDLFKSPRLRKRTLNLMFIWVALTHNFYGLSSNSANFGGNIFINFVAIMFVEVPSYFIAYMFLDRLGRKGTLVLLSFFGGVSCFIASMLNQELTTAVIILSITGKFCIAAAFAVVYIFTIEMFPTQYRSLGLGTCSMSARIGGILAPFTAGLATIYRPLPLIIFGVLAMICGTSLLFLPETYGHELAQTLQESEEFGADQSILYFSCCHCKGKKVHKRDRRTHTYEKPPPYEVVLRNEKQENQLICNDLKQ